MYYIVVKDFTKPIKFFMLDSPAVGAAKLLHQHEFGKLKGIHEKLRTLPTSFGPIETKSEAEEIQALLLRVGARSTIGDEEEHASSISNPYP